MSRAFLVVMEGLAKLPAVAKLSPRVLRVMGLNPGRFTLQGTCTYVVGTGARRLLVDTGDGVPAYPDLLRRALADDGAEAVSDILITHRHHDHVGGIADVLKLYPRSVRIFMKYSVKTLATCPRPFPVFRI